MPHPPHASDSSNCFLFPQMKNVLKAKRFADVEGVKQKMAEALKGIKIDESNCSEQWKKHLHRCVASHGECFEGD